MRKLPIIHVNVDLPVSGFMLHMFFMQNTAGCKTAGIQNTSARRLSIMHWTLTAPHCSVELSDFTQLQRSGCKEKRMQSRSADEARQIWHLTVILAIIND